MDKLIKNIEHAKEYELNSIVEYGEGKVASLTIAATKGAGVTLFAFDKGEKLATHAAPGDALAVALEGESDIVIGGEKHHIREGETIVMPKDIPHSVEPTTRFKMMLVVVK